MLTELRGQIENITYTNQENGFTIARIRTQEAQDLVTVVGPLTSPVPGQWLQMTGQWSHHPQYGRQFKIASCQASAPVSTQGMEKYLGSGLIRGIGPETARRIVRQFGEKTLKILDREPEKLTHVPGIGRKRIAWIRAAWEEQRGIREVMIFLQSHGIGPGQAARIFRRYGAHSIQIVTENPYRLASDVFGIGFLTADRVAEKLGVDRESESRSEAGILHLLTQCAEEGHTYYPRTQLLQRCQQLLEIDRRVIVRGLNNLVREERVILDPPEEDPETDPAVYLPPFYVAETGIAAKLAALQKQPRALGAVDAERALQWVQQKLDITLVAKQAEAIRWALKEKLLVITGGPGTGKTTIMKVLLAIVSRIGARVLLAAPTGRAAKRLGETTGQPARTIHRLLEFNPRARGPREGAFQRDQRNPLQGELLIVDEASMIDSVLMHHLLKAVPDTASLILVGDANQLPSVGAGNVLQDLIGSGRIPLVELSEIFRQAKESQIVVNAHRVNLGLTPTIPATGEESDFYFIRQEEPERVVQIILELVTQRIPRRFRLDPREDIQVLTPMHRGVVGVENLNQVLQQALNPGKQGIQRGSRMLRVQDKVMQLKNNYQKEIFNGDLGRISGIDREKRVLRVRFDGREVSYDFNELDELSLAYAVSVHKAQGCEYPGVIIPLMPQHYMLLQRNLLYTAITRGKRLVVLIGTPQALGIAVKNDRTRKRYTGLRERLRGL